MNCLSLSFFYRAFFFLGRRWLGWPLYCMLLLLRWVVTAESFFEWALLRASALFLAWPSWEELLAMWLPVTLLGWVRSFFACSEGLPSYCSSCWPRPRRSRYFFVFWWVLLKSGLNVHSATSFFACCSLAIR